MKKRFHSTAWTLGLCFAPEPAPARKRPSPRAFGGRVVEEAPAAEVSGGSRAWSAFGERIRPCEYCSSRARDPHARGLK
jgi:hypothetical protein